MSLFSNSASNPDEKEFARQLNQKFSRLIDLILAAYAAENFELEDKLLEQQDALMAEYIKAKRAYARTVQDLKRCPDCPNLGKGVLYYLEGTEILCDVPCRKTRPDEPGSKA